MCTECKKNGAHRYFRVTYKDWGDFSKMPLQVVTVGSSKMIFISLYFFCVHFFTDSYLYITYKFLYYIIYIYDEIWIYTHKRNVAIYLYIMNIFRIPKIRKILINNQSIISNSYKVFYFYFLLIVHLFVYAHI